MPGHLKWNTENHLHTQHTHSHKDRKWDFAVLVLWLHEPNYQLQCVFVCVCVNASARVCGQVRQQTLTVRFHAPQAVPQNRHTPSWSRRDDWPTAPSGSFHKHDNFEEPVVSEPLATDYHSSSPQLLEATWDKATEFELLVSLHPVDMGEKNRLPRYNWHKSLLFLTAIMHFIYDLNEWELTKQCIQHNLNTTHVT